MNRTLRLLLSCFLLVPTLALSASVLTSGLLAPNRVTFTPGGHLLVSENGTVANGGRISRIDRNTGARTTLIDGLPAGITLAEDPPSISGPSGIAVVGGTLYVTIAEGNAVVPGPVPGSQAVNEPVSSPLLSSVLAFDFGDVDHHPGNVTLTPSQQTQLAAGDVLTLGDSSVSARMVHNFPNFRSEPRPDFPENVRASSPYGVAAMGGYLYITDSGWNNIWKVRIDDGSSVELAAFPAIANPTPIGRPTIEPVPDSVRIDGNRVLVTLLTGFPFAAGVSSVVEVNASTGAITPVVTGLTSAIDVASIGTPTGYAHVVTEFSTNMLQDSPGRIILRSPDVSDPVVLVSPLITPTSMALDRGTEEVFVTQLATGQLLRFNLNGTLPPSPPSSTIPVIASVSGDYGSEFRTALQLSNPTAETISGRLLLRLPGPNGQSETGTLSIPYELGAHKTLEYDDFMDFAGVSGIGSLDIAAGVGPAPLAVARVFDVTRSSSSTGAIVAQEGPEDVLYTGEHGVVISAADPETARTNFGFRAMQAGANLRAEIFDRNGHLIGNFVLALGPNQLRQISLSALFPGTVPSGSELVVFEVTGGSAIVYASSINNVTQETSYRSAQKVEN